MRQPLQGRPRDLLLQLATMWHFALLQPRAFLSGNFMTLSQEAEHGLSFGSASTLEKNVDILVGRSFLHSAGLARPPASC